MEDFIPSIDSIPRHVAIDDYVNEHRETFLEFLRDSRMCALNGRINTLCDNFTSVAPKGKAVVDYIVAPSEYLENCLELKVLLVSQVVEDRAVVNLIRDYCRLPDHSLLWMKFNAGYKMSQSQEVSAPAKQIKKRVKGTVSDTFLKSDVGRTAMLKLIERLQTFNKTQDELDKCYDEFCILIRSELNDNVDTGKLKFRKSKQNKPCCNKELGDLWSDIRSAEHLLRKQHKTIYKHKQYITDKKLRL